MIILARRRRRDDQRQWEGRKKETALEEAPDFRHKSPDTWFFSAGTEDAEEENANGILSSRKMADWVWVFEIGGGRDLSTSTGRVVQQIHGPSIPSSQGPPRLPERPFQARGEWSGATPNCGDLPINWTPGVDTTLSAVAN